MGSSHSVLRVVTISQTFLSKLSQSRILAKLPLSDPLKPTACKKTQPSAAADGGDDPSYFSPCRDGIVERQNLFLFTDDAWAPGSELTVSFIEPVPRNDNFDVRELVEWCAAEWTKGIDLYLVFLDEGDPDCGVANVRISFQAGSSHSDVGAQGTAPGQATMNLAITESHHRLDARRMILHEFGHALGFRHEHSSPNFPYRLDKDKVVGDLAKWQRKGTEEAARDFEINFGPDKTGRRVQASEFDPKSIMMYHIRAHWHTGQVDLQQSFGLSPTDKKFAEQVYGPAPPESDLHR
ncbi:uncharacterized protein E0L32_003496 [Thyridium curvatum]|uniref:Peptidase M12A domain-containing protein n=1 Tax=Thyridium curvatum TaxID=1093900 RepID=A0A507BDX6_9PEZI|nr:uncharacterized protein E0L32_003496 [Thyridium curvatum]TPX16934.1 hypothetical protein E0L32_003496 [Thyridium curvatum]